MFEQYGFVLMIVGLACLLFSWLWLIVRAFRVSIGWGLAVLLVPVLGPFAFFCRRTRLSLAPLFLWLMGIVIIGGTLGTSHLINHLQLWQAGRFKTVDGELHVTLTGWDDTDYALLEELPHTVVLQMANGNVNDQTLDYLKNMESLRELDVNDTLVTDAGLAKLNRLPALEIVRLRATKITDDGFRDNLAEKESLLEIDVRETGVTSRTMRSWKALNPEKRRYLK